jgi:uncharacterized coiled-coil DUF342 family protein
VTGEHDIMQTVELARTGDHMADLDHKIDELRAEMREGFTEVRAEFKNVRSEIKDVQDKVEVGFKEIRAELKDVRTEAHAEVVELRSEINTRFIGLERSIMPLWVSLTGGMAAVVAALLATNL